MTTPTFSIVMPAYNAAPYIREAIGSVLAQTRVDWELLVVDDGSTDDTASIVASIEDHRILLLHGRHGGAAAARNIALEKVRGRFLVLLDADDRLPPDSLEARLAVFERHPDTDVVDGRVLIMDHSLTEVSRIYSPWFEGAPFKELVALTGSCFFGPSWMFKWSSDRRLRFTEHAPPAEDMLFAMDYSKDGVSYRHTDRVVLHYRRTPNSSMTRLDKLERAYHFIHRWLEEHPMLTSAGERRRFLLKGRRFMAGAYWKAGRPRAALRALLFKPDLAWWIH